MRALRDLTAGMRHVVDGQRWIARHSRLWAWGALPALITLAGYVVVLTALVIWGGAVVSWATPFADGWESPWRALLRWALTLLLFGGGLLLAVVSFTAVTLLVGQPFYESLSGRVEEAEGGAPPEPGVPFWRGLLISAGEGVGLLLRLAAFGIPLFLLGFVPVLGQTVVPVAGFCVSGFFLTHELTAVAFQRRRIPLRRRLRMLRGRLWLALGFGVPLVALFLVPVVAVLAMPGAVAGATLLARQLVADDAARTASGEPAGREAAGPGRTPPGQPPAADPRSTPR